MYVMKIAASTHESGTSAKVYAYEGHYEIGDSAIEWQAEVSHQDGMRSLSGSIPLTSPAIAKLAGEAVRDAIVQRIDNLEANQAVR
jgi:hypothetical protein